MHVSFLQRLYAHMEWADAFIWRSVLAEEALSQDDYVIDSLIHLHLVQHAYLAVWKEEPVAIPSRDDFGGLGEIRDWARSYHADAAGFVEQLSEARLREIVPIPWTELIEQAIGGSVTPATLGDLVFQVPAHSIHHRAQINRRIREVGGAPGLVDYIGWIWRGAPAADWSG